MKKVTYFITLHPDGRILFRGRLVSESGYKTIVAFAKRHWKMRRELGEEVAAMILKDGANREESGQACGIA